MGERTAACNKTILYDDGWVDKQIGHHILMYSSLFFFLLSPPLTTTITWNHLHILSFRCESINNKIIKNKKMFYCCDVSWSDSIWRELFLDNWNHNQSTTLVWHVSIKGQHPHWSFPREVVIVMIIFVENNTTTLNFALFFCHLLWAIFFFILLLPNNLILLLTHANFCHLRF